AGDGAPSSGTSIGSRTTGGHGVSDSGAVASGTARVTVTSASGISTTAAQGVVNGISYQDTNVDDPTAGTRTFTLTQIQDSDGTANGGGGTTTPAGGSPPHGGAGNTAPALPAGTSSQSFTEGSAHNQGTAVGGIFSGTSISTIEAGQTIKSLTFTVGGLLDGSNEKVTVDGTTISLTNLGSGTTSGNGLSYSVAVASGTAT